MFDVDRKFSPLAKPHDAKQWPSGRKFLSAPHTHILDMDSWVGAIKQYCEKADHQSDLSFR